MTTKEMIAKNFKRGLWSEDMLKKLILKGKMSYADYTALVGEDLDIPHLSAQEAQKVLTAVVQNHLDQKAAELGYDDCKSVCTYVNTGVQKFDDEGAAFRVWRSAVWARCYEILDECKAGTREIPTADDLIAMLPELVIQYSE